METNTLIFVRSWMEPLRKLPSESRWNVMEALVEHATVGSSAVELSPMEEMAFTFIRIEIDRMRRNYDSVCEKRRAAANARWSRKNDSAVQESTTEPEFDSEATVASEDGCKCMPCNADDYKKNIKTETNTYTDTNTMKTTTSSATSRTRKGGYAGNRSSAKSGSRGRVSDRYDDSMLLGKFFSKSNQACLESLAKSHGLAIADLRRLAEEITMQWALTEKTHASYHDAASHLVYALGERIARERRQQHQGFESGIIDGMGCRGVLGVGEYIDSDGRRTYNGIDIIPLDAPPRPGKAFYWNETTRSCDDIQ